jgi:hypothetical protein
MKQNEKKSGELVKVSKSGVLSLVASQLKGKNLFPKKIEDAKKMLNHARIIKH